MNVMVVNPRTMIEWSVAVQPLPGQPRAADLHLVQPTPDGALLAVVDGVGHGEEAIDAARKAIDILTAHAQESVVALTQRCHAGLAGTRGVVMTLAALHASERTLTCLGVGNVEAWVVRARPRAGPPTESVLLRSGIVGDQIPALYPAVLRVEPGDWIIFATDGIRGEFTENLHPHDQPKDTAQRILRDYFKGTDDALVLATRFSRPRHE